MFPNFTAFHLIVFAPKANLICVCYVIIFKKNFIILLCISVIFRDICLISRILVAYR